MTRSSIDSTIEPLEPFSSRAGTSDESDEVKRLIKDLGMQEHPEGGYFVETDRDNFLIPNPFLKNDGDSSSKEQSRFRNASTTIFYLLTPKSPLGAFHRNRARTVHTLHKGRGRYVLIHADEAAASEQPGGYDGPENRTESQRWDKKARVETFVVGQNVSKGERLQWIVEGGKYKTSFLLPDEESGAISPLLISETVVPGFEFSDHDFLKADRMEALVTVHQAQEMQWMLRKAD